MCVYALYITCFSIDYDHVAVAEWILHAQQIAGLEVLRDFTDFDPDDESNQTDTIAHCHRRLSQPGDPENKNSPVREMGMIIAFRATSRSRFVSILFETVKSPISCAGHANCHLRPMKHSSQQKKWQHAG